MSKKKIPVYKIQVDPNDERTGVNLTSFVNNPAIQSNFIALSEQEPIRYLALSKDGHKQILTGPVLIPDLNIYRLTPDGEEYFISFSADTIESIRNKFHKNNFTAQTNDEHSIALDGNYAVESWIVVDPEKDKSAALGLSDIKAGTWMLSYHVPDKDYWDKEILSGNKRGFSIEGFFNYEQIEQLSAKNTSIPMNKILKFLMAAISGNLLTLSDDRNAAVDKDGVIMVTDGDGTEATVLPDGEYTLKDGTTFKVVDGKKQVAAPAPETVVPDAATPTETVPAATAPDALPTSTTEAPAVPAAVAMAEVKLKDGRTVNVNEITRKLTFADGGLVPTGYYELSDGTVISVTTDQYFYETAKTLMAKVVEAEKLAADKEALNVTLAAEKLSLQEQLDQKPAATKINLGGEGGNNGSSLSPGQLKLKEARERAKK